MPLITLDFIAAAAPQLEAFTKHFDPARATNLLHTTHENKRVGFIDVVIEGGGVKGIAMLGALYALEVCGLRFRKIAGTSAGALNAAFLAATGASAAHPKTLHLLDILANLDFLAFADGGDDARAVVKMLTLPPNDSPIETLLNRAKITMAMLRNLNDVILRLGFNPGGRLRAFLCSEFERLNGGAPLTVAALHSKWAHDRIIIGGEYLQQDFQIVVADISRRQRAIFPQDLREYFHKPDEILIGELVRASTSIPVFFSPFRVGDFSTSPKNLKALANTAFVDGGIVSNFPLSIFDVSRPLSNAVVRPKCPTFGLLIEDNGRKDEHVDVDNPVKLGLALFRTASDNGDKAYIKSSPHNAARIIRISNRGANDRFVSAIDFALTDDDKLQLFKNGVDAVVQKLATWDFEQYTQRYRLI